MSQKKISKGNQVSTGSSKIVQKPVSSTAKTEENMTKPLKKSEVKVETNANSVTNKSVKNRVKAVNSVNDKMKTNITTNEIKKKPENIKTSNTSKTTTIKKTSNGLSTNSNIRAQNQSNIKSIDKNHKLINKNNDIKKDMTISKSGPNIERKQTTSKTTSKRNDNFNNKNETKIEKKQTQLVTKIDSRDEVKQFDSEEQANKDSSDEQYVSLATLESYSSIKKPFKTSESIQAEPPSICDTDIEDINNTTDNQINDDFPSDYCDDFEEYESDFEDDEEEDEQQEENETEDSDDQQKNNDSHQDLYQIKEISTEKYDKNYDKEKISPQISVANETQINQKLDIISKTTDSGPNGSYDLLTQSVQSAKIRSEIKTQRNKTIKRSEELFEIIKLNEINFTNFDLPQINYELFIKTFGRKDTKQVSCQTSEREDNESQTDFIQISEKWTQNPSFTRLVSGDQNQMEDNKLYNDFEPKVNAFELIHFLKKAEVLMSAIIDMECDNQIISKRSLPKGAEKFSTNVSIIKCLSLAKKCPISHTFTNSLYLFCVQNVSKIEGSAEKSMISVWSLMNDKTQPVRILICRSHIVKSFSYQNIVVSAMIDGSVALWDLNQESVCDKELNFEGNKFTLRTPSYNCALTSKGHQFPIVDIKKLFDSESTDRLIHFATIDENGIIIIWVINEGKEETNESLLSQTTEHKIMRISVTNHLDKFDFGLDSVKVTAFECQSNDWSNFYCGTDGGSVIRCTNIEESVNNLPKMYQKSELNSFWAKVSVIRFSDTEISKFLVGFTDGLFSYYSITTENPVLVFNANERPIIDFKWIPDYCRMAFIALNNSNQLLIWEINSEQHFKPIIKYKHSNDRILTINIWKGLKTYLVFGCESGQTLVFDFLLKTEI